MDLGRDKSYTGIPYCSNNLRGLFSIVSFRTVRKDYMTHKIPKSCTIRGNTYIKNNHVLCLYNLVNIINCSWFPSLLLVMIVSVIRLFRGVRSVSNKMRFMILTDIFFLAPVGFCFVIWP